MPISLNKNMKLVGALAKALGLSSYHVRSIEIAAGVNKFSIAKVEFAIDDIHADAVAQAVEDNADELTAAP